ncbi:MAG: hypothetical protein IKU07_05135 [Oscillospiraceae bacterium]|nr:hypothetical protein [Oscillospiraceae bacterium]
MKTALLIIFGLLSFGIAAYFSVCAYKLHKAGKKYKQLLSAMQVLTVGIFISVFAIFIPYHYTACELGGGVLILRPLLIDFYNTVRIFLLNAEFSLIVDSADGANTVVSLLFCGYAAVLYVVAPALTFGNVLSFFKNLQGLFRFRLAKDKKCYIFSELNERSLALAKSVPDRDAILVFTGVTTVEEDTPLLSQARDLKAICLKRDITQLDFMSKTAPVELFLVGQDESENVSRAVQLTTELNQKNTKQNVKIFVFSTKPGAGHILDSLDYDNLLAYADAHKYDENCFKLRRVDEKRQLILNAVPKMKLLQLAEKHNKTLSVLVVGLGSYGTEFFKMLVWYCQVEGCKLQFNLVDKQEGYMEALLKRDCPELLTSGEYDIRLFSGVDAQLSGLDDLLLYNGDDEKKQADARRLGETNLAFVSLGDDDVNIEVSIRLRQLLDRVNNVVADEDTTWEKETADIYSVVFDDRKTDILYKESEPSRLLKNHKEIPYHIRFIGSLSSQFSYANIYDEALEAAAYDNHVGWVKVEMDECEAQRKELPPETYASRKKALNEKERKEKQKFEKYEYFRVSSIAKELYKRNTDVYKVLRQVSGCKQTADPLVCDCTNCTTRKQNEHMRWNAYTRVIGYSYKDGIRADRALLHDNLCDWEQLNNKDRQKD